MVELDADDLMGVKVLVVEDHRDVLDFVCVVLQDAGAETLCLTSVLEAVDLVARFGPNVMLADVGMPVLNGCDLMGTLRECGMSIPGVAISGTSDARTVERAQEAGFAACLRRPLDAQLLVSTLRDAVRSQPVS